MTYAMVDISCCQHCSTAAPPRAVTLDIDDTVNVVHGHKQLSLFNAHCYERCFLPIHSYDMTTSRPVALLLRPGTTPSHGGAWLSTAPGAAYSHRIGHKRGPLSAAMGITAVPG